MAKSLVSMGGNRPQLPHNLRLIDGGKAGFVPVSDAEHICSVARMFMREFGLSANEAFHEAAQSTRLFMSFVAKHRQEKKDKMRSGLIDGGRA